MTFITISMVGTQVAASPAFSARNSKKASENRAQVSTAANDALLEKLKSNLKEVAARGGELYVFADADSSVAEEPGVHVLHLPEHCGLLSPVLHVVPLQLLAYHVALAKGTDVDKPRNLAKSVTVE